MLDNEHVLELVARAQHDDQQAKTVLLEENSPLIKSVIKRFTNKGIEYDDLYQLGCIGFLKAIKNFNAEFGVKFSTYVVPMVIGEIKRFLRDDGMVKVSRALKTLNMQINKYIDQFMKDNGRSPAIDEIACNFKLDPQDIIIAMDSAKMPISLYSPIEDDSDTLNLIDRIEADDDNGVKLLDNIVLKDLIVGLNERDKKIILMRYYFDKTQTQIAKELGISQVQVSRLENKILESFRTKLIN